MFASPALGYVRVNYGNSMGYAVALDAPIDSLILTAGLQSGYLSWFSRETGQCIRCEIPSIAFGHTWPVSESLFQTRCYAYDDRRRYVYKMSYQYPGFQSLTLQVVQCNPMHLTFGELEDPLSGNIIDPALKGGQIAFVKGATKDLDKVFVVNPLGPQLFHICYPEQPFGGIPWEPFGPVASGHSQLFYAPTTCAAAPNGVLMTSADGSTGYSKFTDAVTGALLADSATGSFGGNSRAVPFLWAAYNPCSGCIIWNKDTGDSGLYSTDPANGFATNELPGSHGKTYTFVEVDDLSGKIFAMNKNTWSLDIYEQPHNHNQ